MPFLIYIFLLLFCSAALRADPARDDTLPLFSGTLLSFYGENIDPGKISFQPYFFFTREYGFYDGHSHLNNPRNIHQYSGVLSIDTGITKNIDVSLVVNAQYNHADRGDSFAYGDTNLFFGFQIMKEQKKSWKPDIRVIVGESIPSGKFQNLDPELQGSDASGTGAYQTSLLFVTKKTFYNWPNHPWNLCFNAFYGISATANVAGINFYGGREDTKGWIRPGNEFFVNFAFEYKFDYHWGWGIDLRYIHQDTSSFHSKNGPALLMDIPSSESFSLAPCIEYNLSTEFSISGGVWFSVYGRNSVAFTSGVLTFYYYY